MLVDLSKSGPPIMAAARWQPPALDVSKSGPPYYGRRALAAASGTGFIKIGTLYYGRRALAAASGTRLTKIGTPYYCIADN